MAALKKFNPVDFSKNITKTISAVEGKIGKIASAPKTLTDKLNAKTGLNIAVPPLPPINANVRGLVGSVKSLVKNPSGVVKGGISAASGIANAKIKDVAINTLGGAIGGAINGDGIKGSIGGFVAGGGSALKDNIKGAIVSTVGGGKSAVAGFVSGGVNSIGGAIQGGVTNIGGTVNGFAKASFGIASTAVKSSLGQIKGTLRLGIKNCLRSAVSSLLQNLSVPNIPFGGITPNIPNGVSINGVISKAGASIAGAVNINAKINKYLNAEIKLLGNLEQKKVLLTASVTGRLDIIKDIKNTNFYTAKLTNEVNKNINKVCNTLSPRNKKKLSKGGPIVNMVANVASDSIINNLENQVVKAASGFSAKAPTDFFNKVTGLPSSVINKATGKVSIAAETINKNISTATSTLTTTAQNTANSIVSNINTTTNSLVTTAENTANNIVSSAKSKTAQAYNNIKDAINSNVPKQG